MIVMLPRCVVWRGFVAVGKEFIVIMANKVKRYAAKRDKVETEIIEGLRQVGAVVELIDKPVDAIVVFRGVVYLMEIKDPKKGKLTEGQKAFITKADSHNVFIARTLGEALYSIGAVGQVNHG